MPHVGDNKVLPDDSRRYIEQAVAADVDAMFNIWTRMPHGFVGDVGQLHAASLTLKSIGAFIDRRRKENEMRTSARIEHGACFHARIHAPRRSKSFRQVGRDRHHLRIFSERCTIQTSPSVPVRPILPRHARSSSIRYQPVNHVISRG
jgi:hypothetical protein